MGGGGYELESCRVNYTIAKGNNYRFTIKLINEFKASQKKF